MLAAQTTTTTVPRIVGDPLPLWVWWGAGIVLFALILVGGLWARRKMREQQV